MEKIERHILDHLILLLLSAVLFVGTGVHTTAVAAVLCVLCLSGLMVYLSNKKVKFLLAILFFVICFGIPELKFFYSVIVYSCTDCIMEMGKGPVTGLKTDVQDGERFIQDGWKVMKRSHVFAAVCLFMMTAAVTLKMLDTCVKWKVFLWFLLLLLAIVLCRRAKCVVTLEQEMIRLRDTSTELNLVLKEKNKGLMEKQDYEIYLATLRERNRIAREIHDNVGHMLSRSILQVGALTVLQKDSTLQPQLTGISDTLNQAMDSIRESVHDLHDDALDLQQAVKEAIRPIQERCTVTVDYDMSEDIPRNVKYCLIAVIKEAAANIIKHSDASEAGVILREHPGLYQLAIEDNGRLNSLQKDSIMRRSGGIGLTNMEERVNALNGTFSVHTEKGMQIFLSIPKEKRENKREEGKCS